MGSGAGVMADEASSESSKTSRNSASMPPKEVGVILVGFRV